MNRYLKTTILILMFLLASCNEEVDKESAPISLSITRAGFTNFGNVEISTFKIAGIRVVNKTPSNQSLAVTGLGDPFIFHRIDGNCTLVSIPSGGDCTILFRFQPLTDLEYIRNIGVNGTMLNFRGKGKSFGNITFSNPLWVENSFQAGAIVQKTFDITNNGDTDLTDFVTDTDGATVFAHTCGTEFEPNEACTITLRMQKTIAQEYTENIRVFSNDSTSISLVNFFGNVTPGEPFGNIGLNCGVNKLIANLTDTTNCVSSIITDSFGNTVEDGIIVSATGFNLNIDGASTKTIINGVVDFDIRATDSIGDASLVVNSSTASGFKPISLSSGPASGTINFGSFNNQILADGSSTLSVETALMVNSSGVTLTNGEEIEISILSGTGTLDSPIQFTFNGKVKINFTASTTPGTTTILLRSGPIYDGMGAITGYSGQGSFDVIMNPVPIAGNFLINTDVDELYFEKGSSPYNDIVNVNVEVRNSFNSPVGSGVDVEINLNNLMRNTLNDSVFTLTTNASSQVSFSAVGVGVRGTGIISVSSASVGSIINLPIVGPANSVYSISPLFNKVELNYAFADSRFTINDLNPTDTQWRTFSGEYSNIQSADAESLTFNRVSGKWKGFNLSMKDYIWDCMIPVRNYVINTPCGHKKIDGAGFNFGSDFPFSIDVEAQTPVSINGSPNPLPLAPTSSFNGDVFSSITLFSKETNKAYIFGGASLNTSADPIFTIEDNEEVISYADITIFGFLPYSPDSFSDNLANPILASHSQKDDEVYIFGGLSIKAGPILETGNTLQLFSNGDLNTVVVNAGPNGNPPNRYQNAVYVNKESNKLYVIGGLNINDDEIDDVWSIDLSSLPLTWVRECAACGLPSLYVKKIQDIKDLMTGDTDKDKFFALDDISHMKIFDSSTYGEKFFWYKNNTSTYVFDDTLTSFPIYTGVFSNSGGYEYLLRQPSTDRFYAQDVKIPGSSRTDIVYKDMELGHTNYYRASVDLGINAKSALEIKPNIRVYAKHLTGTTDSFGASAYCYNTVTSQWDFIGSNNSNNIASLNDNSTEITTSLTNPRDYVDVNNKIQLLIRPSQEIGYINGTSPEEGESQIYINLIEVEGVY